MFSGMLKAVKNSDELGAVLSHGELPTTQWVLWLTLSLEQRLHIQ